MDGENHHVFHTSALDGSLHERRLAPGYTWRLFAAQFFLMLGFVGMSVAVIGVKQLFGDYTDAAGVTAGLALGGAALAIIAWRSVAALLRGADNAASEERKQ